MAFDCTQTCGFSFIGPSPPSQADDLLRVPIPDLEVVGNRMLIASREVPKCVHHTVRGRGELVRNTYAASLILRLHMQAQTNGGKLLAE